MKILIGDRDDQYYCVCEFKGMFIEDLNDIENFIKECRKNNMELTEIVRNLGNKYEIEAEYFGCILDNYFDITDMETEE